MSDGSIIAAARDGVVTAFTSDLEPIWTVRVGKELLSSPVINTREHSLAISANDTTVVLDTRTGEVLFRWSAGNGYNNSSPTLGPDGVWRITNWGGFAVAIGPAGQELWRTHLGSEGFWSSPTLGPKGELFTAGTRDRAAVGLSPEGRLLWRTKLGRPVHKFLTQNLSGQIFIPNQAVLEALDPRSGESQRPLPLDAKETVYTSIAVSQDGVAYFGTSSRKLRAVDGRHVLWSVPTVAPMEAPPVLIGTHRGRPRLVAADAGGNVICVE
jgi:outer membrane protein assembly factor BamB